MGHPAPNEAGAPGRTAGGGFSTVDDLLRFVSALKDYKLAGPEYSHMAMNLFQGDDRERRAKPTGFGIAGGGPMGINAVVEADFETGYTVIVLSNFDPPSAEQVSRELTARKHRRSDGTA